MIIGDKFLEIETKVNQWMLLLFVNSDHQCLWLQYYVDEIMTGDSNHHKSEFTLTWEYQPVLWFKVTIWMDRLYISLKI